MLILFNESFSKDAQSELKLGMKLVPNSQVIIIFDGRLHPKE